MLITLTVVAVLLAGVGASCACARRDGESWVNFFGTVLVVVSLLYSAGHAALTSDRSTSIERKK